MIRKIGITQSGVLSKNNNCITKNDQYFAMASHYFIYIYKSEDFSMLTSISNDNQYICSIALLPCSTPQIAYITRSGHFMIYDFVNEKQTFHVSLPEGQYDSIKYEKNQNIFLISNFEKSQHYIINPPSTNLIDFSLQGQDSIRNINFNSIISKKLFVTDKKKQLHLYSLENNTLTLFSDRLKFRALIPNPFQCELCLAITSSPSWIIFSMKNPKFSVLYKSTQNAHDHLADWIPSMTDHIVTGNVSSGALHLWNFQSGKVVGKINLADQGLLSLTCLTKDITAVSILNGTILFVDIHKKSVIKTIKSGHFNTVMMSAFFPSKATFWASAGADGFLSLWSFPNIEKQSTAHLDNFLPISSISFSPGGGFILAGTFHGDIALYSVETNSFLFVEHLHSDGCVSVDWSTEFSNLVVSSGDDSVVVFDVSSHQIITKLKANTKIRKIKWSLSKNSQDHQTFDLDKLLLYGAGSSGDLCVFTKNVIKYVKLSNSALLDISVSPLDPTKLAISDDNGNVIIVNTLDFQFKKSRGHHSSTKAIQWSPVIEWLCFSGDFDGKLAIWDTRIMQKLTSIRAHYSGIFSIGISSQEPYLISTSSKDETIRFWSIYRCFIPKVLYSLGQVIKCNNLSSVKPWHTHVHGSKQLLKILYRLTHDQDTSKVLEYKNEDIIHINDLVNVNNQRAITLLKSLKIDDSKILDINKNEISQSQEKQNILKDAANSFLKIGDIKKYCDIMFVLGEYDKALAFAPSISMSYWQSLMQLRADIEPFEPSSLPYLLLSNNQNSSKLINILLSKQDYGTAQLILTMLHSSNNHYNQTEDLVPNESPKHYIPTTDSMTILAGSPSIIEKTLLHNSISKSITQVNQKRPGARRNSFYEVGTSSSDSSSDEENNILSQEELIEGKIRFSNHDETEVVTEVSNKIYAQKENAISNSENPVNFVNNIGNEKDPISISTAPGLAGRKKLSEMVSTFSQSKVEIIKAKSLEEKENIDSESLSSSDSESEDNSPVQQEDRNPSRSLKSKESRRESKSLSSTPKIFIPLSTNSVLTESDKNIPMLSKLGLPMLTVQNQKTIKPYGKYLPQKQILTPIIPSESAFTHLQPMKNNAEPLVHAKARATVNKTYKNERQSAPPMSNLIYQFNNPNQNIISNKHIDEQSVDMIGTKLSYTDFSSPFETKEYEIASKRADFYIKNRSPLLAAASLLSIGDYVGAAWRLYNCGELFWAIEVAGKFVNDSLLYWLGYWAAIHGKAGIIFSSLSLELREKLSSFIKFKSVEEKDKFYVSNGLKTTAEYLEMSKYHRGQLFIHYLTLGGSINEAMENALQMLRFKISQSYFNFSECDSILRVIQRIRTSNATESNLFQTFIAISYYFAIYHAMWRNYHSIIHKLFTEFEAIVKKENITWLIPKIKETKAAVSLCLITQQNQYSNVISDLNQGIKEPIFNAISKGLYHINEYNGGSTMKSLDCGFPVYNLKKTPRSIISGKIIQGNIFILEDGTSSMSFDEALMWFSVIPYSPLNTHRQLCPY